MRSVLLVSMKKDEISIKINEGANYERIIETLNESQKSPILAIF